MKGMIFDIKEFAIFDGPGIRITVFLKGCPLQCVWCHNPEGISFKKELMISRASCINCGKCKEVCDRPDNCILCGKCIEVCPLNLRRICGTEIEVVELASQLLEEKEFYLKNGGGVTFSGGEPFAQSEFLFAVLDKLKDIPTAIETSGYASQEIFKAVVSKVDLIFFDVKHTDPEIHKRVTGVDNGLILKNLDYLCREGKKFIIRIPLIPGINDDERNIKKTACLLTGAEGLEKVELLPYNKAAGAKYPMLGREYNPGFDVNKDPMVHKDIFDKFGIRSVVL